MTGRRLFIRIVIFCDHGRLDLKCEAVDHLVEIEYSVIDIIADKNSTPYI